MRKSAALSLVFANLCAAGAQPAVSALSVEDAWVHALPGADVAAAFLTLRNAASERAAVVIGVQSALAASAMIHETHIKEGLASMRPRARLVIAPGATVRLERGGLHVMLRGLAHPLTPAEKIPLALQLEGGGTIKVMASVRPLSAG